LIITLVFTATAAMAEESVTCGKRDVLLRQLSSNFQEGPVGIGLSESGAVVELLTSANGSWTLIATKPKGPTCLLGTGEGWQSIGRKLATEREG
jgi:hypothetical protein